MAFAKTILQGTTVGCRRGEDRRKKWYDNIEEWMEKSFIETQALAYDRDRWGRLVQHVGALTIPARERGV